MAAVVIPSGRPQGGAPRPQSSPRPPLRVIDGGRSAAARRRAAIYRRRRIGALLVVATVAVLGYLAVVGAVSLLGADAPGQAVSGAAGTSPAPVAVPAAAAGEPEAVHVVRPGDTLWSIARSLEPDGDIRAVVDELADRAGSAQLRVGQRIPLGGLGG